jgi:hypothetical protein
LNINYFFVSIQEKNKERFVKFGNRRFVKNEPLNLINPKRNGLASGARRTSITAHNGNIKG